VKQSPDSPAIVSTNRVEAEHGRGGRSGVYAYCPSRL
jgi:hypothetical protein